MFLSIWSDEIPKVSAFWIGPSDGVRLGQRIYTGAKAQRGISKGSCERNSLQLGEQPRKSPTAPQGLAFHRAPAPLSLAGKEEGSLGGGRTVSSTPQM